MPIIGFGGGFGGGGSSYINGVVETSADLPTTVGNPPLDSVYLSKAGSGVWLINRKPAGLYCRTANNGNASDWTYLGAFPEVNADGNWELYNTADPTKELKFSLSAISTGTTRTLTVPDASGRIQVEGQPIGNTTPSTGAFTTLSATPASGSALTLTGGTVTASAPLISASQTWNNAAVSFTTVEMRTSVTAGNGYLFRIYAGSSGTTERFRIAADGETNVGGALTVAGGGGLSSPNFSIGNQNHWRSGSNGALVWTDTANNAYAGTNDLFILRDAAGTLAQRNAANAQTFRLYNTFTDASNHERGFMRWSSNVFQIGTEAAGTGSARNLELQTGGVTRLTCRSGGGVDIAGASSGVRISDYTIQGLGGGLDIRSASGNTGFNLDTGTITTLNCSLFDQRSGTTAQEYRLAATYTSATNYQRMTIKSVKQTLSALSGASATTTGTFIPDGAVVVGVTTRVATALTGAAGYTIGDGTDADRWGDITGTAIGTTSDNRAWTAGTIECFTAGGNITLTAKTSNFTAGAIEICVFYLAGEAD